MGQPKTARMTSSWMIESYGTSEEKMGARRKELAKQSAGVMATTMERQTSWSRPGLRD